MQWWGEFLKVVGPLIGWILVIVGWLRVTSENDRRQERKEVLECIENLEELLEEIQLLASEYYSKEGGDAECQSIGSTIKTKLKRVSRLCVQLIDYDKAFLSLNDCNVSLRKAVTGGEFESKGRLAYLPNHAQRYEIGNAVEELVSAARSKVPIKPK